MKTFSIFLLALPLVAAPPKIAVIGLLHSHVWGQLPNMVKGDVVKLVGVAEPNPELLAEAKKAGVTDDLLDSDYKKMLDEEEAGSRVGVRRKQPAPGDREVLAPEKINIIFEKPLASTAKMRRRFRRWPASKSGI